jgi:drug/metabolite transporter (DMT)-like permease
MARRITQRYGALVVLAYTLLFGAPLTLAFALPSFVRLGVGHVTPLVWLGLFWSIVLSSVIGWSVWAWVNAVRGVARSAPLMYLPPPIAGIIAWLTLGEHFTAVKIAGAAVTMAGVAWAQYGGGHAPSREEAQPDPG